MILVLLAVAVVLASLARLVIDLRRDRPLEPPRSHFVDPDFLPPAR